MVVAFDIFRPLHAEFRGLPELNNQVRDLGLVGYWRTTGEWGDFCRPLEGSEDFKCF